MTGAAQDGVPAPVGVAEQAPVPDRPVPANPDELAGLVEHYETRAELSWSDFEHYFKCEVALENLMLEAAVARSGEFDLDTSRSLLDRVIELNRALSSSARRELERVGPTDEPEYIEALGTWRELADAMVLHLQGRVQESHSEEALQRGETGTALTFLGYAYEYYAELGRSPLPYQAALGERRRVESSLSSTLLGAVAAMNAGQHQTARQGFREARESYQVLLEDSGQSDAGEGALQDEFLAGLRDHHLYARVLYSFASFFVAVVGGDTDEAVVTAEHAVTLGEDWLRTAQTAGVPAARLNSRVMELGIYRGWYAWIRAEKAADEARWEQCRGLVREARQHWGDSSDLAMRSTLRGILTSGVDLGQLELLLQSTLRRIRREKDFLERLQQRQVDAQALSPHIYVQGGTAVSGDKISGSAYNFAGSVTAGAIGDRARNEGDITATNTTVTSPGELRELADQLRILADQLAAGARSDAEHDVVREVREAEEQARKGDETRMQQHLRSAGRWALMVAEKLILPAAQTAISASLGG